MMWWLVLIALAALIIPVLVKMRRVEQKRWNRLTEEEKKDDWCARQW